MTAHCGTCRHTEPNPNDLKQVICFGCPPSPVVVPQQTPQGVMAVVQMIRPSVEKTDRACAQYEAKLFVGANDEVSEPPGVGHGPSNAA